MKIKLALALSILAVIPLLGCGPPPPLQNSAKHQLSKVQRSARRTASKDLRGNYSRLDAPNDRKGDAAAADDDDDAGEGEGEGEGGAGEGEGEGEGEGQ